MFDLFGGDGNGDHDGEDNEGAENHFLVAETFGDETVQRETENFTAIGGLEAVNPYAIIVHRNKAYIAET